MAWHFNECVNSPSSQEQVEASWAESSLDGAPSALLSLLPGHGADCCNDSGRDGSNHSRSGMMSAPSTASGGAVKSMSSAGDSHVRTSALPDAEQASTATDPACGPKWRGSSARYDRRSRSWRTHQCSLLGGLEEFSETWPNWGMMLDGELFPQARPVTLMAELASGSLPINANWPTPTCADAYTDKLKSTQQRDGSMHSVTLSQAVGIKWPTPIAEERSQGHSADNGVALSRAWPTPVAYDAVPGGPGNHYKGLGHMARHGGIDAGSPRATPQAQDERHSPSNVSARISQGRQLQLAHQVGLDESAVKTVEAWPWATPLASDHRSRRASEAWNGDDLPSQTAEAIGVLNPDWVESLMAWPIGWTSEAPMVVMAWPWAKRCAFVAMRGRAQHAWEAPRTCERSPGRNARIKAIGNGQDVSAFTLALRVLTSLRAQKLIPA